MQHEFSRAIIDIQFVILIPRPVVKWPKFPSPHAAVPRLVATLGDSPTIDSWFKPNDWNEAHIIALGNNVTHILNGHVMSELFDEDATTFHGSGLLGIEVETTGKLFVRNIWLRRL